MTTQQLFIPRGVFATKIIILAFAIPLAAILAILAIIQTGSVNVDPDTIATLWKAFFGLSGAANLFCVYKLAVISYQHKLMWTDFERRKRLNGGHSQHSSDGE